MNEENNDAWKLHEILATVICFLSVLIIAILGLLMLNYGGLH